MSTNDKIGLGVTGHVLIRDKETHEVLRDEYNAINFENMSYALALSLSNRSSGHLFNMVFGNGGSIVSGVGTINYLPPNVTGQTAALYNQTYSKIIDDLSPLNNDVVDNNIRVVHTLNTFYSDIKITCTLGNNEPSGQAAYDNAPVVNGSVQNSSNTNLDVNGNYIFDELGLMTFDSNLGTGRLVSHVIFHPLQKALNRAIEIVYTIRIIVS